MHRTGVMAKKKFHWLLGIGFSSFSVTTDHGSTGSDACCYMFLDTGLDCKAHFFCRVTLEISFRIFWTVDQRRLIQTACCCS
jgi:hypothetical protein